MKKAGLFPKIIYYIFTFLVGIILAFTLPPYFFNFDKLPKKAMELMDKGDFQSVMLLTGNYYDKKIVYEQKFDDTSGIFLFEAVMPLESVNKEQNLPKYALYKTYLGYVYGIKDSYSTTSDSNNRTAIEISTYDVSKPTVTVKLADYDADGDGEPDGIATATQYGFIYVNLPDYTVPSIRQIKLVDSKGDTFQTSNDDMGLDFQTEFFQTFDEYIFAYNDCIVRYNNASDDTTRQQIDTEQRNLYDQFKAQFLQNADYELVDNENADYIAARKQISKAANLKASLIIVAYFVCIYIIADFLLGSHYIIKFFNWFLFKVCRIPRKQKKAPKKEEVFGHDYYSMVTLKLDLSAVPEFGGSVEIRYNNGEAEAKWTLLKAENYTSTQRIKAGTYVNPFIDVNRDYAPVNLPDNLEVEGYRIEQTIKIVKRDGAPADPAQTEGSPNPEPTAAPRQTESEPSVTDESAANK